MIQAQGGNVGLLREYAQNRDMVYFAADSPLGPFDSIIIKRKLNVRNIIFITTYESNNVEFKSDIKICANKNPSLLIGLLDEYYYKYIKPFHTLDGQYEPCNLSKLDNDKTITWYGEQDTTGERISPNDIGPEQIQHEAEDSMFIRL